MRLAVACVLAVVAALAIGLVPSTSTAHVQPVTAWQHRFDDAPLLPLTLPGVPEGTGHILELRTTLPAHALADAVLAIDAVTAPFEAWVDGTRVLVHPDPEGLATTSPPGLPWQLVPVPSDGVPHELVLRIRAAGQGHVVRGTPLLGARAAVYEWAIDRDVPRLAAGLAAILIGVLGMIVLGRPRHTGAPEWRVVIGFALATIGQGLYVVIYTHLKELLVDAPRVWFFVWIAVVPLQPIGALLFLDGLFGSGPRGALRRLLQVQVGYALVIVLAHAVAFALYTRGDADLERLSLALFSLSTNGLRILLVLGSLAAAAVIARRALAGDDDARVYLCGFLFLFTFVARDVAAALGSAAFSWQSQVHVGVLGLTVSFALLLARRYARAHERAAALAEQAILQAREKERLLRDLHDGVGTLTSNVRMLADLGQRRLRTPGAGTGTGTGTDASAEAMRTLATIAELSGAALAELRSFVQALDDTTMTWEALVAELRRYSASVADAAGVPFKMTVALDVPSERPPGLLTLHVVRIVREALTNALKQADACALELDVTVSARELVLVVTNARDAAPGGERHAGIDASRGLGNLSARAAELGGSLDLAVGPRTSLTLRVPLPLKPPDRAAAAPVHSSP